MGEKGCKLEVLVDARKLKDGGIGQYTYTIIDEIVCAPHLYSILNLSLIVSPDSPLPEHWKGKVKSFETTIKPYSLSEQLRLGRVINQIAADVVHIPHFTLPLGINAPTVVTIHDLIQIKFPERLYYPLVAKTLIRSSLKRATRIVVVSESTKRDLETLAKRVPESVTKIHFIPNAVDPFFCKQMPESKTGNIRAPLFLAVYSNAKPHKGIQLLFDSFSTFCAVRPEGSLHVVGQGVTHQTFQDLVASLPLQVRSRIHVHGEVSREELRRLYQRSNALVVSSYWEGFCLPVVEAHGCGTPVITTPVPAVLELTMQGDIVAEDFSSSSVTKALMQFVEPASKQPYDMSRWERRHVVERVVRGYFEAAGIDKPDLLLTREPSYRHVNVA